MKPVKIGIIGAGFSGVAVAASLHKLQTHAEIYLFEKSGHFGEGDAYRTPYPFHLLNVRASDMSAFEDQPDHFVEWLKASSEAQKYLERDVPCGEQFVSRLLFSLYLKDLLVRMEAAPSDKTRLHKVNGEVVDIRPEHGGYALVLSGGGTVHVDKVVLALGNTAPASFPVPVPADVNYIANPWDYTAPEKIDRNEPVLIIGTGLSMIDTTLTLLRQGHQGKIYALSRHGLLPLPHADGKLAAYAITEKLPETTRALTEYLREKSRQLANGGGDWRSLIHAMRENIPALWQRMSISDKRRFLRHVMPYWNIHRHRVKGSTFGTLRDMMDRGQLAVIAGKVAAVDHAGVTIRPRHSNRQERLDVRWIINCMGPSLSAYSARPPLVSALLQRGLAVMDPLSLGFAANADGSLLNAQGIRSDNLYIVGPLRKSVVWEAGAVPEIRKQCFDLARVI